MRLMPLFFVHVPKTAGTSFRKAAENYYGFNNVVYDYSTTSSETSSSVLKSIYEDQNYLRFYEYLNNNQVGFLSGHVHAGKYVHLFGARQVVTFLRDPVQRVVSEYYHFVRNNGYKDDLPSFYRKPQFINRQSKMMQGVPLQTVGLLGLTEEYEKSLDMLNSLYGTNIEPIAMNVGRKDKDQTYNVPKNQLDEIRALNEDDIRLYNVATHIFHQRHQLFLENKPFVHGMIQQLSDKSLTGWAWGQEGDTAIAVDILVEGKNVGTVEGRDLRPGLLRLAPPRKGYIGFHHNFVKPLAKGTVVQAVVAETGQLLDEQRV